MALRCLIVDDNAEFLEVARDLLEREGVEVVGVVENSVQAVACVAGLRPDVVIVDMYLGHESGLDLARRLTSDGGPAVILTSTYDEADLDEIIGTSPTVVFLSKDELSGTAVRAALGLPTDQ